MGTCKSGRLALFRPNCFGARKRRLMMLPRVLNILPPLVIRYYWSMDDYNHYIAVYGWRLTGFGNFENWGVKVRRLKGRKVFGECGRGAGATAQGPGHFLGTTRTVLPTRTTVSRSREWNRGTNCTEVGHYKMIHGGMNACWLTRLRTLAPSQGLERRRDVFFTGVELRGVDGQK